MSQTGHLGSNATETILLRNWALANRALDWDSGYLGSMPGLLATLRYLVHSLLIGFPHVKWV